MSPKWNQMASGYPFRSTPVNGTSIPSRGDTIWEPFWSPIGSLRPHKIAKSQKRMLSDTRFFDSEKNIEKASVLGPPQTLRIELPLQREHRSCVCARSRKRHQKDIENEQKTITWAPQTA